MNRTKLQSGFILSVVLAVLSCTACEIGLGPAVDTESPTVTITYPVAAAAIKGEFTLAGTWDDDNSVSRISVSVTSSTTGVQYGPYTATVDKAKTWTVSLNQTTTNESGESVWTFPDGKYEISAIGYDNSNHSSGISSRAFEIDNTAPVFIISSPAVTDITKAAEYGSVFSVSGTIADDHSVSSMTVSVFNKDGTPVTGSPFTESDIATAGGTSVTIARYIKNGTDTVNTRYTEIYGTNSGKASYYCTVQLSDAAKTYTDPSEKENTTVGNTTTKCYLYDSVYTSLMSTKNGGLGLDANDFKELINGTFSKSVTRNTETVSTTELLSLLNAGVVDSNAEKTRLAFSLNPDANPRYVVNGLALPDDLKNIETATKKQKINIVASAGLDGILIKPQTLVAWIKEFDSITDKTIYSEYINNPAKYGTKIADNDTYDSSSVKTYPWSVTLPESIHSDKYYIIAVTGTDADGMSLVADGVYGFVGAVSGNPPQITIDSPAVLSTYADSDSITFSGTASSTTATVSYVSCTVTVTDEAKASTAADYTIGSITGTAILNGTKWTFSPKDGTAGYDTCKVLKSSGYRYLYTAEFTAYDMNGNHLSISRSVHVDALAPKVTISSVSPIVYRSTDGAACVNGTITVGGSVNESDLQDVVYDVFIGDSVIASEHGSFGGVYSFSKKIDTTKYADGSKINIVVTATDKSGNTGSHDTNAFADGTSFLIDQSTDRPVITVNNADTGITNAGGIRAAKLGNKDKTNIFTIANNKVTFSLSDDDGIATVIAQYKKFPDASYSNGEPWTTTLLSKGTSTLTAVSYTLPSTEGLYSVLLTVTDTAGTPTTYNVNTCELTLAVDEGAPNIALDSASPVDGSYCTTSFVLSGTIDDDDAVMNAPTFEKYNTATNTYDSTEQVSAGGFTRDKTKDSWTNVINTTSVNELAVSGQYRLTFTAEDAYGQSRSFTYTYKIDDEPPTFTVTKLGTETLTEALKANSATPVSRYVQKSNKYSVYGTVTDTGDSGIDEYIYYQLYQLGTSEPGSNGAGDSYTLKDGWSKAPITKSTTKGNTWSIDLDVSGSDFTENDSYTVYLAAKDIAGNVSLKANSPSSCLVIVPDAKAPKITSVTATPNAIVASNADDPVTIKVEGVADGASGVKTVQLYENGSAFDSLTSGSNGTYIFSIPSDSTHLETGIHTFTVTATDGVGNVSEGKSASVTVDKNPPVVSISAVTPTTTRMENNVSVTCLNGIVTVTGIATDETKLASISWVVKQGTVEMKSGAYSEAISALYQNYSFTIDTRDLTKTTGVFDLIVTAKDFAGNESTATTNLNVDQRTDLPVITLTAPADTSVTAPAGITLSKILYATTDTLGGTITDDDGIKSITVTIDGIDKKLKNFTEGAKSYTLEQSLSSLTEGSHAIQVAVIDTALQASATTGTFYIGIDNTAPDLVVTTESGKYYNKAFTIEGKAKDTYAMASSSPVKFGTDPVTSYATTADATGSYVGYYSWSQSIATPSPNKSTSVTKTITAYDTFGRSTAKSFTYIFDFDKPEISTITFDSNGNGNTLTENSVKTTYFNKTQRLVATGTASDSTTNPLYQSGLSSIKWAVTAGNPTDIAAAAAVIGDSSWTTIPVSSSWTINADLSGNDDGVYTLFVKAIDVVGNETVTGAYIYAIGTNPVLTETTIGQESAYRSSSFELGGNVTAASLSSLTYKRDYTDTSNATTTTSGTVDSANWSDGTWSISQSSSSDGTYTYTVTATNKAKMTTSVVRAITIDTTAPTVAFTVPASDGLYYATASEMLRGTASDAGSGIKSIEMSYDGKAYVALATSTSWLASKDDFTEGSHTATVRATDNATNFSTATRTFIVDLTDPSSAIKIGNAPKNYPADGSASNGIFYRSGAFDVTLDSADTYFKQAVLSITKDGVVKKTITHTASETSWASGNASWTYTPNSSDGTAADGTYVYTLTVSDLAGHTKTSSATVCIDATAPTFTVTTPAANECITLSSATASGSVSDAGVGMDKVYYSIDGTDPTATATVTGNTWNAILSFAAQGKETFKIKTADKLGNVSEVTAVTFYYDEKLPEIEETSVTVDGITTNAGFTLSGTASDTNALFTSSTSTAGVGAITITAGSKSWTVDVVNITKENGTTSGSWSKAFSVGTTTGDDHIDDGTTTFALTVKDGANRTTTIYRTVKVDTKAPSVSQQEIAPTKIYLDESVYGKLSVTASDSGTGATGLAGVYCKIATTQPTFDKTTESSWTALALGEQWTANVDYSGQSDGTCSVYIAAKDNAGNRMVNVTPVTVTIDRKKPVISVSGNGTTTGSDIEFTIKVTDTNPGEPVLKLLNSLGNEVSGSYVTLGTRTTTTTESTWKATVKFSDAALADGKYTVQVNDTDSNGRAADVVTSTVLKDTVSPDVSMTSPATSTVGYAKVNYITFSGTASDANLKTVIIHLYKNGSEESASDITNTITTDNKWEWKKYDLDEGSTYKVKVVATDAVARETQVESGTVQIDTIAPSSDITLVDSSNAPLGTKVGTTYYSKNAFTVKGTIVEASSGFNANAISLVITKNGTPVANVTSPTGAGTWSYDQIVDTTSAHANDGLYVYTLTMKDKAGNSSTTTATVCVDTTGPAISTSLKSDIAVTNTVTQTYTLACTDTGSGMTGGESKVTCNVNSGTYSINGNTLTITYVQGIDQTISITALDLLGNTTTVSFTNIDVDVNPPELTLDAFSTKYTNSTYTVSGTAYDAVNLFTVSVSNGSATPLITIQGSNIPTSKKWSYEIPQAALSENVDTLITVTARDSAGNATTKTTTVFLDTKKPEIVIKNLADNQLITEADLSSEKYTVNGTWTDNGGSGISGSNAKLEYKLGGGDWTPVYPSAASWSQAITLAQTTGTTLSFRAVDFAGNTTGDTTYTFSGIKVDTGVPTTGITAPGATGTSYYKDGDTLTVSGTATDTLALDYVEVIATKDGTRVDSTGAASATGVWYKETASDSTTKSLSWSKTLNCSSTTQGTWAFSIKAYDKAGRVSAEATRTCILDATKPTATFSVPNSDGQYLTSATQTFSGTAGDGLSGLKSVEISYDGGSTYSSLTTSTAWFTTKTGLSEKSYSAVAKVTDNAGNNTLATRQFYIDLNAPTTTLAASSDRLYNTADGTSGSAVTAPLFGSSYLAKETFTLSGVISEEHFADATFSVTKDGNAVTGATFTSGGTVATTSSSSSDAGAWTYEQNVATDHSSDGVYVYTIGITDKAGRSFNKSVTVTVDTKAPSLDITSPATNEAIDVSKKTAKGTASDSGAGVASVTYALTNGSGTVADTGLVLTGETWTVTDMPLGTVEGALTLTVTAKDKLGYETVKTVSFSYDKEAPHLTETNVTSAGVTTNKKFTLSGKTWDTNKISKLEIKLGNTTWSSENAGLTLDSTAKSAIASEPTNDNWSKEITVGSGGIITTDGTYDFTVTATDAASKTYALTRTVKVDTTAPTLTNASVTTSTASSTTEWYNTASIAISVEASDTLSGVSTVAYSLNGTTWYPMIKGSSAWTATATCAEGSNTITIKATDAASNSTDGSTQITAKVDTAKPAIVVTKAGGSNATTLASYYTTNTVAVEGTVADLNMSTFSVSASKNGEAATTLTLDTTPATGNTSSGSPWKFNIPSAGEWNITITAKDALNHETTSTLATIIDSTVPVLSSDIDNTTTWFATRTPGFTVHVKDNGTDGSLYSSGMKTVTCNVGTGSTAAMLKGEYNSTGFYYDYNKNYTFTEDGSFQVTFAATDAAGNNATSLTKTYNIDTTAPSSTLKVTPDTNKKLFNSSYTQLASYDVTSGNTYYANGAFTLSGTITETNFASAVLSITKNGVAVSGVSSPSSAGAWSYTQAAVDGLYVYTLTMTDKAGLSTIQKVTVRVDTTGPVITVTAPVANESVEGGKKTLKGTFVDAGAGNATITYAIENASGTILKDSTNANITGTATQSGESWSFAEVSLGTTEGTVYVHMTAKDVLGNETSLTPIAFYFDSALPTANESEITVSGKTTNNGFSLVGTASDTNALFGNGTGAITISTGSKSWTANVSGAKTGNWSQAFLVGTANSSAGNYIADGITVFTITVKDAANKTYSFTRTVTVDTNAPSISNKSITTTGTSITKNSVTSTWYKTQQIGVSVTAADGTGGTGVASVEYSTDFTNDSNNANDTWNALTKGATAWTGAVTCSAQGANTIYFKVTDVAGNTNDYANATLIPLVDTTLPTGALYSVDGNTSFSGVKLVNGNNAVSVILTATDDQTGVTAVSLKQIGSQALATAATGTLTDSTNNRWILSIPTTDLASGGVTFTVTNGVGNTTDVLLFQMQLDNTAPTAAITVPADADTSTAGTQVNKNITLSGTASDDQTLSSVKLQYKVGSGSWTDLTATITGTYNWTSSAINTATAFGTVADGTSVTIRAVATDSALNTGSTTDGTTENAITLVVNQNSDRPVIKLTNVLLAGTTKLKMNSTVYGTISDDDGAIGSGTCTGTGSSAVFTGLWYTTSTATAPTYATMYSSTNTTGVWHAITVENGSWSADATDGDGTKTWYFYAVDSLGAAFSSSNASNLNKPYLSDTSVSRTSNVSVTFSVDTTPPVITDFYFAKEAKNTTTAPSITSSDWVLASNITFGGMQNALFMKVNVTEATGMDATTPVSVSFADVTKTATITPTHTAGSDVYTYIIGPFVLDNTFADGTTTVKLTATDSSGQTATPTRNIVIDNTAPTVTVTAPLPTTRITSTTTIIGSVSDNAGGSGAASIQWLIPTNAMGTITTDTTGWNDMTTGTNSATWTIALTDRSTGSLANPMTYCNTTTYAVTNTPSGSSFYHVPVCFLVKDTLGNASVRTTTMYVDIDGGKPIASVLYPTTGNSLGGIIRAYGTATDIDGTISSVQMQFDLNGDGNFNKADYDLMSVWANSTNRYDPYYGNMTPATWGSAAETSDNWGFVIENGADNWSVMLNQNKELDAYKDSANGIAMRVRAYDDTNLTHGWSDEVRITINTDSPLIGNTELLVLRQYANNDAGTGTVTAEKAYYEDMWISGKWWLYGSVEDTQGISSIVFTSTNGSVNDKLNGNSNVAGATFTQAVYKVDQTKYPDHYDYIMNIPLYAARSDGTNIKSSLYVVDASTNQNSASLVISVNVDNTAPAVYTTAGTTVSTVTDALRVKSGENVLGDANNITQSNNSFTLGDAVYENGSGFERLIFYFERQATSGDSSIRVYNPMYGSGNRTDISATAGDGLLSINSDNLPAYQSAGSLDTVNSFTATTKAQISSNYNVRVGGLIKVLGVYHVITSVDRTNGKVNFDTSVAATVASTTVEFIYGNVVDHLSTSETPISSTDLDADGNLKIIAGTDDTSWPDGMIESIERAGALYTWSAAINSKHLVDGPIQIHVVAFDKAGNAVHGYATTSVQNNRPRLACVVLATDLNANNTFNYDTTQTTVNGTATNGEFSTYSALDGNGKTTYQTVLASTAFTVKKELLVLPEFVNNSGEVTGNGQIGYVKSILATTAADATTAVTGTPTNLTEKSTLIANNIRDKTTGAAPADAQALVSTKGGVLLTNTDLASNEGARKLVLSFWDSTEGLTYGSTTQWAVLTIPLTIDIVDNVAPLAHINPFYWNSASDNSLYGNSSANGHIELENDLPSDTFKTTNTGLYDIDPKVSGKIRITGDAYDDTLLKSIALQITDMSLDGTNYSTMTTLATYTAGSWAKNTAAGAMIENFIVNDANNGPTQLGHSVTWELDLDTSKMTNVAGTNKVILVKAVDAGSAANASDITSVVNTATGALTPYYRVDVVPYITGITTWISGNAGNEFARSALGYYDVYAGESVVINGFNMKQDDLTNPSVTLSGSTSYATVTASTATSVTVKVNTTAKTGALKVTVNSIETLNNVNASPTFDDGGIEPTGGALYNSWANGLNNNRLTDDIKMYVWNMGYFVENTKITDPVMKMDASGNYYMAYDNNTTNEAFQMVYRKNDTITNVDGSYNKFHNCAVVYDDAGKVYAAATNTDRVSNASARFKFYTADNDNGVYGRSAYQDDDEYQHSLEQVYNVTTGIYDINRVPRPKMFATGTSTAKIFMSYFDANHSKSPVKFRYGINEVTTSYSSGYTYYTFTPVTGTKTVTIGNQRYDDTFEAGQYLSVNNVYCKITDAQSEFNGRRYTYTLTLNVANNFTSTTTFSSYIYTQSSRSVLTGGLAYTTDGEGVEDDSDLTDSTGSAAYYHIVADSGNDMTYKGGLYTAVGATSGGVGLVAWYDASHKELVYSYNETPGTPVRGGVWQTNAKVIDANYSGWYVDMCVDKNDGIHIAYYSTGKGDLKYAYLPSYNCAQNDIKVVTVDSYLSAGTDITINTREETVDGTTYIVPYISYYHASFTQSPSSVRVAWMPTAIVKGGTATISNGAVSDKFTQKWEVAAIPTTNVPTDSTICNGVPTSGTYASTPVLGYMSDAGYERAYIQY